MAERRQQKAAAHEQETANPYKMLRCSKSQNTKYWLKQPKNKLTYGKDKTDICIG